MSTTEAKEAEEGGGGREGGGGGGGERSYHCTKLFGHIAVSTALKISYELPTPHTASYDRNSISLGHSGHNNPSSKPEASSGPDWSSSPALQQW